MNELLTQGVAVMFIGMGTVLAFLCVTIGAVQLMSLTVRRFFPVTESVCAVKTSAGDDESIAVAILSAVLKK